MPTIKYSSRAKVSRTRLSYSIRIVVASCLLLGFVRFRPREFRSLLLSLPSHEITAATTATLSSDPFHLPSFGKCERDLATHFLTADYGYDAQRIFREQQERDADLEELTMGDIFDSKRQPMTKRWAGVHFNYDRILEYAQRVIAPWKDEWSQFPESKSTAKNPKTDYYRNNGMHDGSDPILLHSFVRAFKPRRVLEIGSGFSSRVTVGALALNERDCEAHADFLVLDPSMHRMPRTPEGRIVGPTEVHNSWLEDEDLSVFSNFLQAGDLFFIDSSHALGFGGSGGPGVFFTDVMEEYSEILPRLQPGVVVHIHDIAWPDHYWFYERNWAEQLVLQAFLSNNPYFDILWCGGANRMPWYKGNDSERVERHMQQAIEAVGPHLHVREVGKARPFAGGGSIWIRRNSKPYKHSLTHPTGTTKETFLSPMRGLAGVSGVEANEQLPRLRQFLNKVPDEACQGITTTTCITCAFLADASGTAHIFGVDNLRCPQMMSIHFKEYHRQDLLSSPLKTFTSLKSGDSVLLGGVEDLDTSKKGEFIAGTIMMTEIAPRLASGVIVVLFGVPSNVAGLIEQKQNSRLGGFVAQAWMAMNDAFETLWSEDSGSANAAGFRGDSSDSLHTVILQRL